MITYNPTLFNAAANRLFITGAMEAIGDSYVPLIATVYNSTRKTETHAHMGPAAAMAEFKGEVVYEPMSDASFDATNKKYTAGIKIDEDDFDDDQLGAFPMKISEMGQEAVLLPNYLLMQALIDADSTTASLSAGYDGSALVATHGVRHREGGTQSNTDTGTGTTTATIGTDVNASLAALRGVKLENGRYANRTLRQVTIAYPAAIRKAMLEAINATIVSNTDNVSLRSIQWTLIEDPQLEDDDANDYYLMNTGVQLRALVLQQRKAFQLIAEGKATGVGFDQEVKRWKSKWRGVIVPGRWQHLRKITNT